MRFISPYQLRVLNKPQGDSKRLSISGKKWSAGQICNKLGQFGAFSTTFCPAIFFATSMYDPIFGRQSFVTLTIIANATWRVARTGSSKYLLYSHGLQGVHPITDKPCWSTYLNRMCCWGPKWTPESRFRDPKQSKWVYVQYSRQVTFWRLHYCDPDPTLISRVISLAAMWDLLYLL